ncbi:hypothetical protein B0H14DRAFT_2703934 [Mycena olivaceomarginata]|nr:hypothetical protein B0H14DRAFT_2703934 [Mycena olivaceomarginata]
MNMFLPGTRVFYWNGAGQTVYGTVKKVAQTGDGTMVVNICNKNDESVDLPASSVHKVT